MSLATDYLNQCRQLYHQGMRPLHYEDDEFKKIVLIAKNYISRYGIEDFSKFLQEGKYYVDLWTAHLIFNCKEIPTEIYYEALERIKTYSRHPLDKQVAEEEKGWLDQNTQPT